MRRYGEEYTLDQDTLDIISTYMDDEIRERLHYELAPCEPEEFLARYLEEDRSFVDFLWSEFRIEL